MAATFEEALIKHERKRTAVHEAGHAVIWYRMTGKSSRIRFCNGWSRSGVCVHSGAEDIRWSLLVEANCLSNCAGHFAQLRWAEGAKRGTGFDGAEGDFSLMVQRMRDRRRAANVPEKDTLEYHRYMMKAPRTRKEDVVAARALWNKYWRKLDRIAKRDATFKEQVLRVAQALLDSPKGILEPAEVEQAAQE